MSQQSREMQTSGTKVWPSVSIWENLRSRKQANYVLKVLFLFKTQQSLPCPFTLRRTHDHFCAIHKLIENLTLAQWRIRSTLGERPPAERFLAVQSTNSDVGGSLPTSCLDNRQEFHYKWGKLIGKNLMQSVFQHINVNRRRGLRWEW